MLKDLLLQRRDRVKPSPDDYIFAGAKGGPLNFHNLENRIIRPALKGRQLPESEKSVGWQTFSIVEWTGWHGFRRGLATNLFDLGAHPRTIAAILRHSDVNTTMKFYVKDRDNSASRDALDKFEESIRKFRKDRQVEPLLGSSSGAVSNAE
jgi:integrase